MNTHLDDQGSRSRQEGAKIILKHIEAMSKQDSGRQKPHVILAGDFNSEPNQEAYIEMTKTVSPMSDLQMIVSIGQRYGDENTYSGFQPETVKRKRIDFIFINNKETNSGRTEDGRCDGQTASWLANGYAVMPNIFENGIYISDHQAVIGDVTLV